MIAFGCAMTDSELFHRCAEPGMKLAAESDSDIMIQASVGSIFRNYNLLLDRAAELDDLEALVLVHQDAEIVSDDLCARVREALADPDVAIVGCVGAVGVRSIAWWEGSVTWAGFTHRYGEGEGEELPGATWDPADLPPYARLGEVDTVDGFCIAVSPWAIRGLRFDESISSFHGYDYDYCLQARAAGKKVVTADFRAVHHHSLDLITDLEGWMAAHQRVAEKWSGRFPDDNVGEEDLLIRARRAEAAAAAARIVSGAEKMLREASTAWSERRADYYEQTARNMESGVSWRVTAPLRGLRRLLSRGRNGSEPESG